MVRLCDDVLIGILSIGVRRQIALLEPISTRFHGLIESHFTVSPYLLLRLKYAYQIYPCHVRDKRILSSPLNEYFPESYPVNILNILYQNCSSRCFRPFKPVSSSRAALRFLEIPRLVDWVSCPACFHVSL